MAKSSSSEKPNPGQTRKNGTVINNYLEALEANRPRRGRKKTPESIAKRIAAIEAELADAKPVKRLKLIQERMDCEASLARLSETVDITALEDAFVEVAASYGDSQGISYAAWKELGVDNDVLKRAGVAKSS